MFVHIPSRSYQLPKIYFSLMLVAQSTRDYMLWQFSEKLDREKYTFHSTSAAPKIGHGEYMCMRNATDNSNHTYAITTS